MQEDTGNNHDIFRGYMRFNWFLSHAQPQKIAKQLSLLTNQCRALSTFCSRNSEKMDKPEVEDYLRCPGNSPACLGMVKFDFCGTQRLTERLDKESGV